MSCVYVIIPVFNRLAFTRTCLGLLRHQTHRDVAIVVVDGGSTDGTPETITREYPEAIVLNTGKDLWWAGSTRLGVEYAFSHGDLTRDHVLFLNNDTEIPDNYIQILLEEAKIQAGAIGALVVDAMDPDKILDAGEFIDWDRYDFPVKNSMSPDETGCTGVDTLPGRGTLVPLAALKQVGNVDAATFPHYLADYDLFSRLKAASIPLYVTYRTRIRAHITETGIAHAGAGWRGSWHWLFSRRSMGNVFDHWHFIARHAPVDRRWQLQARLIWRAIGQTPAGPLIARVRYLAARLRSRLRLAKLARHGFLVTDAWLRLAQPNWLVSNRLCQRCGIDTRRATALGWLQPSRKSAFFWLMPKALWRSRSASLALACLRSILPLPKPRQRAQLKATLARPRLSPNGSREPLCLGLEWIDGSGWTGGAQYIINLIYVLGVLPPEERPSIRILSVPPNAIEEVQALAQRGLIGPRVRPALPALANLLDRIRRRLAERLEAPQLLPDDDRVDVTYPGIGPKIPGAARVSWLPDLQHIHLPHLFDPAEVEARRRSIASVAARKGVLVLSSQAVRADFLATHPNPRAHIRVFPFTSVLTSQELDNGDQQPSLPARFVYIANQFWQHKDHATAFRAIAILRDQGTTIPLICTGLMRDHRCPQYIEQITALVTQLGLEEQICLLGLVPRGNQIQILRRAALVIQPSLFEGWSTVIEDARAIGRPVLASDIPVHIEQLADMMDASLFQRGDAADLARRLAERWATASAGPDLAREQAAMEAAEARRLTAGRLFMDITREALLLEHAPTSSRTAA